VELVLKQQGVGMLIKIGLVAGSCENNIGHLGAIKYEELLN
jgi:hypothetical protein